MKFEAKAFRKSDSQINLLQHLDKYVTQHQEPLPSTLSWVQVVFEYSTSLTSGTLLTFCFLVFCVIMCLYLVFQFGRRVYGLEPANRPSDYVPVLFRDVVTRLALMRSKGYLFLLQRAISDRYNIPGHQVNGFTICKVAMDYCIETVAHLLIELRRKLIYAVVSSKKFLAHSWEQIKEASKYSWEQVKEANKPYMEYRVHRRKLFYRYKRRILGVSKAKERVSWVFTTRQVWGSFWGKIRRVSGVIRNLWPRK